MTAGLARRVDDALEAVGRRERAALERCERDGAGYGWIAEELEVRRAEVAELIVAARLTIAAQLDGGGPPPRVSARCGPARAVVAAQQDGEAVSARDLDRALAHIEGCAPCQDARVALQEARLACRAWRAAPAGASRPERARARARPPAPRRRRRQALLAGVGVALVMAGLLVAAGNSGDDGPAPVPVAPTAGPGSAEGEEREIVPPPGDEFCLPDEPGCG